MDPLPRSRSVVPISAHRKDRIAVEPAERLSVHTVMRN